MSKNRILQLEKEIREHNRRYYDEDTPLIGDVEYDKLRKELESLCPDSPVLQDIGHSTFGEKHTHSVLMGSLTKCHSALEILEKFRGQQVIMMPKIDGCSLSVSFDGGRLKLSATRGDGFVGEVVTANAASIVNMPSRIGDDRFLEVRGEAYIAKSDFYGTMDQPGYGGKEHGLANPRNAAAGSLRQKDSAMTCERKVRFVAYEAIDAGRFLLPVKTSKNVSVNHRAKLEILSMFKFETPPYRIVVCDSEESIQSAIDELKDMDASLPYETDGIVVRINDQDQYDGMGLSGKCSKAALAYKFESVKAKSKVLDVEWTTSRTGRVVPVAIIEPTRITGSIVSRITLNNLDWIKNIDVAIGDEILFEKANEIIPRLVSVLFKRLGARDINMPDDCPSCGCKLDRHEIDLYCPNDVCPAQFQASVIHILEKLDIKGIAESTVSKIIEGGLIHHPWDIFGLSVEQLSTVGFGDRQVEIIHAALHNVEASKSSILACMGIEGWGKRMFDLLSDCPIGVFLVVNPRDLDYDKISQIQGIGPIRVKTLIDGLEAKQPLLRGVLQYVKIKQEVAKGTSLKGLSFCITGTLSKGRGQVQADITQAGGDVKGSISAKLNYLVAGDEAGSKLDKAKSLGVKVISEQELYSMINV